MKKITLNRNGQTCARNRETSDLKAGRFQICEHVMLGITGDCCYHRKSYAEYVVSKIEPCDRFGGGRETVTFERVYKKEGSEMSEELKPCPFCGEPAKMETITDIFHRTTFMVTCGYDECLVHPSSDPCEKRADAVYAWNRRAGRPLPSVGDWKYQWKKTHPHTRLPPMCPADWTPRGASFSAIMAAQKTLMASSKGNPRMKDLCQKTNQVLQGKLKEAK